MFTTTTINQQDIWEVEVLHYEGGKFPRYRKVSQQHTDEQLKKFANPNYFGYEGVGELTHRTVVQKFDNEDDARKSRNTLRAYYNAIGVTILKANFKEKVRDANGPIHA